MSASVRDGEYEYVANSNSGVPLGSESNCLKSLAVI